MVGLDWRGDFHVFGGNAVYGDGFTNCERFIHPRVKYWGAGTRSQVLQTLTKCAGWAYPNFTDDSETQCVSVLEAQALGLFTVVPNRQPFREVCKDSVEADDCEEMAKKCYGQLAYNSMGSCPDEYSESVIMPRYMQILKDYLE
jgi:hypothetical protein